jgi:hypothetical protein
MTKAKAMDGGRLRGSTQLGKPEYSFTCERNSKLINMTEDFRLGWSAPLFCKARLILSTDDSSL